MLVEDQIALRLYLEKTSALAATVEMDKPVKRFYLEKIGKESLFAIDEIKKLFAMVCICSVRATC